MSNELEVHYGDLTLGVLTNLRRGEWGFQYAREYLLNRDPAVTLSLRFPPRARIHLGPGIQDWFRHLLPEGEVRTQLARRSGVSADNDFALLELLAGDCPGAISLHRSGETPLKEADQRPLSEEEVRNLVAALPVRPLLIEVEGARLTLPGERHKVPVTHADGRLAIPLGAARSTHIAKSAKPGLRESVINEAFSMLLARKAGIRAADIELRPGVATVLMVRRIDRIEHEGAVKLLHMEDFCQLSLLPVEQKYQRESGLGFGECARLIRKYSALPAVDIKSLIQWATFNFFIGNGGAHAKQLVLLHLQDGPRLGQYFGLQSTHVYPELSDRLAMAIGTEDRPDWLLPARWREFAEQIGVKPGYVIDILDAMAQTLPRQAAELLDEFQQRHGSAAIPREIRGLIDKRARQVLVSLQAESS